MTVRRVKLAHVAKAAGVSVSTASQALAGTGRVSQETRDRVLAAAEKLGYRTNMAARSLRVGTSPLVGCFIHPYTERVSTDIPYLYWPLFQSSLLNELTAADVGVIMLSASNPDDMAQLPVDAIVTTLKSGKLVLPKTMPAGMPLLVTGEAKRSERYSVANYDVVADMTKIFDHLRQSGAQRPGLLIVPGGQSSTMDAYATAYETWCQQHSVSPVVGTAHNWSDVAASIKSLMDHGCDGLLGFPGHSQAVLAAFQELNVSAPTDILYASLSEGYVERTTTPSVTTLSLDGAGAGRIVARHLIELMNGGPPRNVTLPSELVVRESSLRTG